MNLFRRYNQRPQISLKPSKTDYSNREVPHPDDPLNNEYVARVGSQDLDRPLCTTLHDGVICQRPVRRGRDYCYLGRNDA